ncbi:MAG: ABC transporter ATP-binding protein, partial [Actinomycetia bacterium]|nr:ABC transporter ATP-binding protein [Actinomycetes bacterium]
RAVASRVPGEGTAAERVDEVLQQVGLDPQVGQRRPDRLSGGQLQRVALARALLAQPRVVVADEVVSALDVATQDEVAQLLRDLQKRWGFALLFITHDLGVARQVADEVMVMAGGAVVEQGPPDQVLREPVSLAAQRLVAALPRFPWR